MEAGDECDQGFYYDGSACTDCPAGYTTSGTGATSVDDCNVPVEAGDQCLAFVIAGCEDTIIGAMGVYEVVDELCDGKPMYQKTHGRTTWFYSSDNQWFIGPTGCGSGRASAASLDETGADDPSAATEWACINAAGTGVEARDLTVTCTSWSVSGHFVTPPPPLSSLTNATHSFHFVSVLRRGDLFARVWVHPSER